MQDEISVHEHGVHMIGPIENVVGLELVIPNEFQTSFCYHFFLFENFMVDFNRNKLKSSLEELDNKLLTRSP